MGIIPGEPRFPWSQLATWANLVIALHAGVLLARGLALVARARYWL